MQALDWKKKFVFNKLSKFGCKLVHKNDQDSELFLLPFLYLCVSACSFFIDKITPKKGSFQRTVLLIYSSSRKI